MKIGIIGSGNVGGTLGSRWAKGGHEVVFGSRDPNGEGIKEVVRKSGGTARAATLADTARASDVLLLATPSQANKETLAGLGDLAHKILIDATNPLLPQLDGLTIGTTTSGGEQVSAWARGARVVKALNTVGFNIMADPAFGVDRPVMFYCGDDNDAKQVVKQLIDELGFEAVDAGPLRQARQLEPFALLWITLAYLHGLGREIGFKLLRR